ncbi:MAG: hypothetical protein HY473_00125 [Candidatus Sungbacteria bacterium]|uniref:Uncharacterized protein n=1 Tax=Candidatus Sungiibacteriota bacterium TaxID=2750080 RepID=A0A933DT39_9BACT|nr:hypothetical protein [Candidatus Sungbacteria bacterium]
MIAAKVRCRDGSGEDAWLGVSLDHIRRDARKFGHYLQGTLREVPLTEVMGMPGYARGAKVIQRLERKYRGGQAPFIPGSSTYSLGFFPRRIPQPA